MPERNGYWCLLFQPSRDRQSGERGNATILVALALTTLLGFGAMVTDLGSIYMAQARLRNALDAAALAGVQELPASTQLAMVAAVQYAAANGYPDVQVGFEAGNMEIIVQGETTVRTVFARVWGFSEEHISATAKAVMVPPSALRGAVPLGIQEANFIYGQLYTLKEGGGDGSSGWYGALRLSGPGARDYETDLTYGYQGELKIGDILEVQHGNMSGPTKRAIAARLAQDSPPENTFDSYHRDAPEIIYVPIVRSVAADGSAVHEVEIVGFGAFFLEGMPENGDNSEIQGRFVETVLANGKAGGSLQDLLNREQEIETGGSSSNFGLYAPKLVE